MPSKIEHYSHPIPRTVKAQLAQLHSDTLPADTVPSFRQDSAALIRVDGEPVAYVTFRVKRRRLWIDRIGVLDEHRGEGFAGRLLDFAMNKALHTDTYIAAYNVSSQRLFISRGFMPYAWFREGDQDFIRFSTSTDTRKAPK